MKTFMRLLVLLVAAFAVTALAPSEVYAKQKTIYVMVIEGDKVLTTEVTSANELADIFVLDPGEQNRGQLRKGADKMNIDGIVGNMRERMKHGEGGLLSTEQSSIFQQRVLVDAGGGCTSSCFKAYRAGDGDVICAGGCRDCQVETCTP